MLHIEVVSDIVCPWCYIGKRRIEAALASYVRLHPEQAAPQLSWLPFQLNPDMPEQGMSRSDYLLKKFGTSDGGTMYERISAEGRKEGLTFNFQAITRQPNTLKAHALLAASMKWDETAQQQSQLKEALMQAYFCEGADLTKDTTLETIATNVGISHARVQAALQDHAAREEIAAQDQELRRMGINGVPFFIIGRQLGISGAQSAQSLLAALEQANTSSESHV
jgi:predicted DsbA family dithiol-disulfide isomerase